ncbi:MAG: GTP-binding protein [Pseudorhodobacter sp.]|nr:MAG: GTP-binding protein [Pseudorhodobacter sp.]
MTLISVTILTGFLGSGKTTLLKRVLSEAHGEKIAVIENEFGEESIDADILVADGQEQIIQMTNGCICCSIRDDLRSTLTMLATKRFNGELAFDRVIIETTGLADPGPVAQTFFMDQDVVENYVLDSIVTLVDAKHGSRQISERQEVRRQIGFADRIFISKADLVEPAAIHELTARLRNMNVRAPIEAAHFGDVPLAKIFDLKGFNLNARLDIAPDSMAEEGPATCGCGHDHGTCGHDHGAGHHHHHDDDVKSFVYRGDRPFDPARLEDFLSAIVQVHGQNMLRYKGVLDMKGTDRKVIFQGVHQVMGSDLGPAWKADEPRQSRMVFIGVDLPKDILIEGLEKAMT